MSMAMAPQPEMEPRAVIQERLDLIMDEGRPVPLAFRISGDLLPIKDLSPDIEEFRDQKAMLDRSGSGWPSVRVSFRQRPILGSKWIPLDLRDAISPHEPSDVVDNRLQSGVIQGNLIRQAERANLVARLIDTGEVSRSFRDVVSDVIIGRASRPVVREDDEPPSDEFEITTDLPRQEVLFATGYFISTRQGFGISTPAKRRLEWGSYIFGINMAGELRFSDTLWTVPDVRSIHLTV
jgi:hypothetical protein